MAYRDRSQGFGFIYRDLRPLLEAARDLREALQSSSLPQNKAEAIGQLRGSLDRIRELQDRLDQLSGGPAQAVNFSAETKR